MTGGTTHGGWWAALAVATAGVVLAWALAPAFVLAQRARWVDLDGPALLECDREGGFEFRDGRIGPPAIST